MNDKFNKLEILESSTMAGQEPGGGGSNKWFNVVIIVLILLVVGVFGLFQMGALSISDLVKKDPDDVMVFNTTESTESTTISTSSTTRGINGTTIGTTRTTRITTTTEPTTTIQVEDEVRALFEKLKRTGWECTERTLTCTNKEKHGEIYYVISFDLINKNFKLKNDENSEDKYEYTFDFNTRIVTGNFNGTNLKYNSNQSFFVYDTNGNAIKGQPSTIASRTETYAAYYINKTGALVEQLFK
jgi:hypothetical protein